MTGHHSKSNIKLKPNYFRTFFKVPMLVYYYENKACQYKLLYVIAEENNQKLCQDKRPAGATTSACSQHASVSRGMWK